MAKVSKSEFHQMFKDRAKNRSEDLLSMYKNLQYARKASRGIEVAELEAQFFQMLEDMNAELNEPSPASSLQQSAGCGSFDLSKLLQICDEEDDATSGLTPTKLDPVGHETTENVAYFQETLEGSLNLVGEFQASPSGVPPLGADGTAEGVFTELDYLTFDLPEDFGFDEMLEEDGLNQMNEFIPPPSAFFGPKCALWDCLRPAQGSPPNYCNAVHASFAQTEGRPGMKPVLRPKGIDLKDSLFFAALNAKTEGKNVGVPECEGAATARSPWNAPELFDMSLFEGETVREWLFFDKPRRAFDSGNRKQRSLPDYNGRGWHESRKQVINESGWLKRSYYMDPQPTKLLHWHLYEYDLNKCDACALYRLELKLVDPKKGPKGKVADDSVSDLQKQMSKLTAEFPLEGKNKRSVKGREKANSKNKGGATINPVLSQLSPTGDAFQYGQNAPLPDPSHEQS
uniref:transcription factor VOZ1-like n=1 Tax=Erigeron canadensis TaxID=72917 RepID=UPI001CB8A18C|nr:transcription factor VOZ1-like [Erigeron canadensis]